MQIFSDFFKNINIDKPCLFFVCLRLARYEFRTPPRRLQINLTRRVSVRTSPPKEVNTQSTISDKHK